MSKWMHKNDDISLKNNSKYKAQMKHKIDNAISRTLQWWLLPMGHTDEYWVCVENIMINWTFMFT